jgi:hypothetical protein
VDVRDPVMVVGRWASAVPAGLDYKESQVIAHAELARKE